VCAFGVTAAAQVTHTFLDPSLTLLNAGLTTAYSLVVGVLLGIVIIRLDLLVTGDGRRRAHGRRARTEDSGSSLRPEPGRTQPLL
jgi:hypothetical protein